MTEVTDRIGEARPRRFRPYPEYRDSGVEWLGKIPTHWKVIRLKTMASVQLSNVDKKSKAGQVPVKLCNYVDVYYNDRITAELEFMNATATPEQARRFLLRVDDVMITKDSESWNDIAVPAVVAEDLTDVLCGYHLAQIKPRPDFNGRFLARQFSAIGGRDQFQIAANGITRFGLGGNAIRTGLFPIAPVEEQRAIAAFLDRKTAKIDGLVEREERLIELLQEKRIALITRAVNRGLDPNVPMKDSGVEWLGEIPAHWEMKRLSWLTKCLDGKRIPLNAEERGRMQGGYPYWGTNSIVDYVDNWLFDEELVLLGEDGAPFFDILRPVAFRVTGKIWVNNHAHVLRPQPTMDAEFLAHVLNCVDYRAFIDGSTRDKLTQGDMEGIPIQCPEVKEQRVIAAFLDRKTAKIDALIAKVHQAIDRLKEFRTALISAAVTGQIDVREEAS